MSAHPGTTDVSRARGGLQGLRRAAAPAAKRFMLRAGVLGALRTLRPNQGAAILRYHAVCGPEGHAYADPTICVTPAAFEAHVAYLARNYRVLPLPEVTAALRAGRTLPRNTVVFTFDDGYADNLEAARILHRHGASGTFYITAGCLKGGAPFWPAEIRGLLPRVPGPAFDLEVDGRSVHVPYSTPVEWRAAVRIVSRVIKSHSRATRDRTLEQLRRLAGHPDLESPMLTWTELAEMARLGMTVGGHTLTHANLPSAGLADATDEITACKARLERELGIEVAQFSYPNGGAERYYTPEIRQAVIDAGFAAASTSENGFSHAGSDLFALERVQVAESLADLVFALEVERFAFAPAARRAASGEAR